METKLKRILKKYWKVFDLPVSGLLIVLIGSIGCGKYTFFMLISYAVLCGIFYSFFIASIKKSFSNTLLIKIIKFLLIIFCVMIFQLDAKLLSYFAIVTGIFYLLFPIKTLAKGSIRKKTVKILALCLLILAQILLGLKEPIGALLGCMPFLVLIILNWDKVFGCGKYCVSKYFLPRDYKQKKVSVIIPNYNYEQYLNGRISSVLKQTYPISELIILDDASSDNSASIIEAEIKNIKNQFPGIKVRFIANQTNGGNVFKQWEKAFRESSYEYVWIAEADDLCDKHFLCATMRGFQKSDNIIISYTESSNIDENGIKINSDCRAWSDFYHSFSWQHNFVKNGKTMIANHLSINNSIPNVSAVVFRKKSQLNYGKILREAQQFHLVGDWYFYEKLLLNRDIAYCKESLNYFRVHSSGVTRSTDHFMHFQEMQRIQQIIEKDVILSEKTKQIRNEFMAKMKKNWGISSKELFFEKLSFDEIFKEYKIQNTVLLSVIVPVYNNEKYIKKCLDSILINLPPRTEIIIINDGSTDGSEKIIKEYKNKYNNIRYVKQKNSGLAAVKNVGLKEAKGEYIIFLDSDDYIASNGYATMLKEALIYNRDLVHCDFEVIYPNNKCKIVVAENRKKANGIERIFDCGLMASSCNKMIRKKLYEGLAFPEGLINEDVAVTPVVLIRCKNIGYIDSPFYKYVQHEDSMNNAFSEKRLDIFKTVKLCLDKFANENSYVKNMTEYYLVKHQLIAFLICNIPKIKHKKTYNEIMEKFCYTFNEIGLLKDEAYLMYEGTKFVQDIVNSIKKYDYRGIENIVEEMGE